jgi:plasmid maintenance system antidote protein VapI
MNLFHNIMESHALKSMELAEKLDISESYLSMLLNGERNISKNIALKLHREFKIPLEVSLCPEVHK